MAQATHDTKRVASEKPRQSKSSRPKSPYVDPATLPDEFALLLGSDHLKPLYRKGQYLVVDKRLPCGTGDLVAIYPTPDVAAEGGGDPIITHMRTALPPNIPLPIRMSPRSEIKFALHTSHQKDAKKCAIFDVHKMQAIFRIARAADPDEVSDD